MIRTIFFSGNKVLTSSPARRCCLHQRNYQIWRKAALASTSYHRDLFISRPNNNKGKRKKRLVIISWKMLVLEWSSAPFLTRQKWLVSTDVAHTPKSGLALRGPKACLCIELTDALGGCISSCSVLVVLSGFLLRWNKWVLKEHRENGGGNVVVKLMIRAHRPQKANSFFCVCVFLKLWPDPAGMSEGF